MYPFRKVNVLLGVNVPLQEGKCTPGGTCTPGWEPLR